MSISNSSSDEFHRAGVAEVSKKRGWSRPEPALSCTNSNERSVETVTEEAEFICPR